MGRGPRLHPRPDHAAPASEICTIPGRRAPSLWSLLPGGPREWQPFRDQYVLGAAELPVDRVYPLRNVTPSPDPSPGPPRRELALAYTGNEYGYLETCGCKRNQMGGVARR